MGYDLMEDSEENIYVVGVTQHPVENADIYLLKTDVQGEIIFEKYYGENYGDLGNCIVNLPNGDLLISGMSYFDETNTDITYVVTDTDGNLISMNHAGGKEEDQGWCSIYSTSQEIVTVGRTYSSSSKTYDVLLIKETLTFDTHITLNDQDSQDELVERGPKRKTRKSKRQ